MIERQNTKHSSEGEHYIVSPFPLAFANASGLTSALLRECRTADRSFQILSPDYQPFEIGLARIIPVDQGVPVGELDVTSRQVLCGEWQLIHPEAYLPPALPSEVAREMFSASETRIDNLETLIAFLETHMERGRFKEELFNDRWRRPLLDLPRGAIVHWQEFFLAPAMNKYADRLRQQGCLQTLHLHESLPDSLYLSEWGRSFLQALSKLDVVYLHTDLYGERLGAQLERLGLRRPAIRRFDLGIDQEQIRESLARFRADNLEQTVAGWSELCADQQAGLREIAGTRDSVPHRFICLDRIDPIKGTIIMLRGIGNFLQERLEDGLEPSGLIQQFRFFFLHTVPAPDFSCEPHELQVKYQRLAAEELARLADRFPGVIWSIPALQGPARSAVPALLAGCHGLSASVQEGLNLAVAEAAYVNSLPSVQSDCSVVLGSNAGFALQAAKNGSGHLAQFPASGSLGAFSRALREVVRRQQESPGVLRSGLEELVKREVLPRRSSLLEW